MPGRLEPGSLAAACDSIANAVTGILEHRRPVVVALDGGSGAGKSTLAERLAGTLEAVIVPQDDFYSGEVPQREDSTFLRRWHALWDAAEAYHFDHVGPRRHSTSWCRWQSVSDHCFQKGRT